MANSFPSFLVIVFYLNKHIQATNENIIRARLKILLLLALPFLLVDLKGIRAITLNKTKLFHIFFIYQEIFIRKYVLVINKNNFLISN